MTDELRSKIQARREELWKYDRLYRQGKPVISDTDYDQLCRELQHWETEWKTLTGEDPPSNSPTQRVGSDLVKGRKEIKHRIPMLSIENAYSIEELREFGNRVQKQIGTDINSIAWVVELKVDGTSASLIYENGLLTQAVTRGDGEQGNDITHNAKTIRDIPLKLEIEHPPEILEVRGEIYIRNPDFIEMKQAGILDKDAKNPRNVAAGTIGLDNPKTCAERRLRFFAHSTGSTDMLAAKSHWDFLKEMENNGINPTPYARRFDSFAQAIEYCEALYTSEDSFLSELDFEIDGLVLKVDDFSLRKQIGATGHHPRWVVAYKVEKYEAVATIREIRVQVGKNGTITPVAELEPVELAGTTVSRASLHNAEEIERKDIRVGDVVIVEKAGKIIPHIVRVETHLRTKKVKAFVFPSVCPACGSALQKDEGGVYIRCNHSQCPAQFKEKLRYFAGRNAMDIEGLGETMIDQLVESGLVKKFGDLYRLTWETIRPKNIERMKAKPKKPNEVPTLVQNLLDGIEQSKERELNRFINALSIRNVGNRTATILTKHFETLDKLRSATESELCEVGEIGDVTAKSICDFFRNEKEMLDDLLDAIGETPMSKKQLTNDAAEQSLPSASQSPLTGMTIVVTGTLDRFKRTEIEEVIERYGGRVSSSVSSKTSFVLVGSEPGSKLTKAKQIGVRIVGESEFLAMIGE